MHQAPLPPLRCPTCNGSNVSFSTDIRVDSNKNLHVAFTANDRPGYDSDAFPADRARVCLDCGYVLLFVAPDALTEIRQRIAAFGPTERRR